MSSSILHLKPISRVRRNHGLEHATIHVLNKRFPHVKLGGMSTPVGFTIVGEVTSEDVAEAAIEALKRLRSGEVDLAFHPNCGTNYAIPGIFAGLIITRTLGPLVQKQITVAGDPEGLELERVETSIHVGIRMHRVITKG